MCTWCVHGVTEDRQTGRGCVYCVHACRRQTVFASVLHHVKYIEFDVGQIESGGKAKCGWMDGWMDGWMEF